MTVDVLVVGDCLLDRDLLGTARRLCPDAPVPVVDDPVQVSRPGGAGLAALLAAADGRDVVLVTALADDGPADELREMLDVAGVHVVDLGLVGTTREKVRIRSCGHSLLRLDRGRGRPADLVGELPDARATLVSDYGGGVAELPALRSALSGRRVVWDPHVRGPEPVPRCALVTPNAEEACHFAPGHEGSLLTATAARARDLVARWQATGVSITLGSAGALLCQGDGPPSVVPAAPSVGGDPCGAGDRFASTAAGLLADGALPSEAVAGAVAAASAFVAAGGAAEVPHATSTFQDAVALTRARGGTVVATGGCFDLLHAGHVTVLQQARALGDCLVVCLNSDDSVRRLKGPGRPLQSQADRARVLEALACVDAVVLFDEDTPMQVLERLRPDVWAKGGDYALTDLPESAVVRRWGGQAVVLPYLEGRSTSALIREVVHRG